MPVARSAERLIPWMSGLFCDRVLGSYSYSLVHYFSKRGLTQRLAVPGVLDLILGSYSYFCSLFLEPLTHGRGGGPR